MKPRWFNALWVLLFLIAISVAIGWGMGRQQLRHRWQKAQMIKDGVEAVDAHGEKIRDEAERGHQR